MRVQSGPSQYSWTFPTPPFLASSSLILPATIHIVISKHPPLLNAASQIFSLASGQSVQAILTMGTRKP
jgi:hypothetical protein